MGSDTSSRHASEWLPDYSSASAIQRLATPGGTSRGGYYGLPMLKPPTWHWHVVLYFFFEGISAGSFLLASLAELFGRGRLPALTRAGYYVSFAAFLPCPPLLIADLGRPERFHHMLRIFKPTSPMSHGSWALLAYSAPVTLLAARQFLEGRGASQAPLWRAAARVPARLVGALGVPLALLMSTYPGVLLSTTSNPLWSRSRFLGALFASSALHTGAAALSLTLGLGRSDEGGESMRLEQIERLAGVAEALALGASLATAGRTAARPLVSGRYSPHLWLGAVGAGLALPALLGARAPKRRGRGLLGRILGPALALAGGLALKWAITKAGRVAAQDPESARRAAQPSKNTPGWAPRPS